MISKIKKYIKNYFNRFLIKKTFKKNTPYHNTKYPNIYIEILPYYLPLELLKA
jgi:hypothetical protein